MRPQLDYGNVPRKRRLQAASCIAGRDRVLDDVLAWYSQYGGRLWGSVVGRSDNLSIDPKYAGGGHGVHMLFCATSRWGYVFLEDIYSHLQLLLHVLREAQPQAFALRLCEIGVGLASHVPWVCRLRDELENGIAATATETDVATPKTMRRPARLHRTYGRCIP